MRLGVSIGDFSNANGPACLGQDLARVAQAAISSASTRVTVMDHYFQIGMLGPPEMPMLEGYTTLAFLAGQTRKLKLGTL